MKICVTGATGFIGQSLISKLLGQNHQVSILSRRETWDGDSRVNVFHGDLSDETTELGRFVENCDVIFHCAGELNNQALMRAIHVEGTRRLLVAAAAAGQTRGTKIHWIQLSSVGAYGGGTPGQTRIVTEESALNPVGEYEVTKTESDKLVQDAASRNEISFSILRPSNVFGSHMSNRSLFALIAVIKKKLFFFIGPKGAISTYVHVEDVIDALLLCQHKPQALGQIYNLSDDCLQEELVKSISSALDVPPPKVHLPEMPLRLIVALLGKLLRLPLTQARIDALVARTTYPSDKIYRDLGFKPGRPVLTEMKNLVAASQRI